MNELQSPAGQCSFSGRPWRARHPAWTVRGQARTKRRDLPAPSQRLLLPLCKGRTLLDLPGRPQSPALCLPRRRRQAECLHCMESLEWAGGHTFTQKSGTSLHEQVCVFLTGSLLFSRKCRRCGPHPFSSIVKASAGTFLAPWRASGAAWSTPLTGTVNASRCWTWLGSMCESTYVLGPPARPHVFLHKEDVLSF